jgi:hypothetical protein
MPVILAAIALDAEEIIPGDPGAAGEDISGRGVVGASLLKTPRKKNVDAL